MSVCVPSRSALFCLLAPGRCVHVCVRVCVCMCVCVCVACSFPAWMCFWAPGGQATQEHMASHCSARGSAFPTHTHTHARTRAYTHTHFAQHSPISSLCDPFQAPLLLLVLMCRQTHTHTHTHTHTPSSPLQVTDPPPPHSVIYWPTLEWHTPTHTPTHTHTARRLLILGQLRSSRSVGALFCCCWINWLNTTPATSLSSFPQHVACKWSVIRTSNWNNCCII